MSQIISANMNDVITLREANDALRQEVLALREELAKYKPEYQIDFNLDERTMTAEIKQFGKLYQVEMQKQDIDYHDVENKISIFASELIRPMFNNIKAEIAERIRQVDTNITNLRDKGLW